MFCICAIVLFCLTYLSQSAPLTCEDLIRPLNEVDSNFLEGKWAFIAGSLSHVLDMETLGRRQSATATFSSNTNETTITLARSMREDNKCYYSSYNISLEGVSFTFHDGRVNTTFTYTSCPDCILMNFDIESGRRLHFYLFSRRRQLKQVEIEEFRHQVDCLKLPKPVVMDSDMELCPEEEGGDGLA